MRPFRILGERVDYPKEKTPMTKDEMDNRTMRHTIILMGVVALSLTFSITAYCWHEADLNAAGNKLNDETQMKVSQDARDKAMFESMIRAAPIK